MHPKYKPPSDFLAEVSKRVGWGKDTGRGYILHPQVTGITLAVDDWKRVRRVHAYSTSWKALDHITAIKNIKHGFKDVEFVDRHGPRGNRRYVGWQWLRQTSGTFAEEVEKAHKLAKLLEPYVERAPEVSEQREEGAEAGSSIVGGDPPHFTDPLNACVAFVEEADKILDLSVRGISNMTNSLKPSRYWLRSHLGNTEMNT